MLALAACLACVLALPIAPAAAEPSAADVAADRAALEQAVAGLEAARTRAAGHAEKANDSSARLDEAVEQEAEARDRLRFRVAAIYRTADADFVSVLLGADTLEEFVSRWDMLVRIARQDATTLVALKAARAEIERTAEELLAAQAEEARALDGLAEEVARARGELASSEAALREYEARTAASAPSRSGSGSKASAPAPDADQKRRGSGEWKTAVASHYGRNFTGRGASGEAIGPYSMIVAHKTLPFGTLVEFEYGGRRAVARVADRGPYTAGRDFDLGPGVVRVLDFSGVHEVRYRIIGR